jgi:hypothetical protein
VVRVVHGGFGVPTSCRHGRLLAEYDPAAGPDNQVLPMQTVPEWVAELDASPR